MTYLQIHDLQTPTGQQHHSMDSRAHNSENIVCNGHVFTVMFLSYNVEEI